MQHGSVSTTSPTIPLLTPFLNREGRRGAGGPGRVSRLFFPLSVLVGVLFLLSFSSCHHYRYSERRTQLDSLQRANQADTVFRNDSLQRILADYFDAHGTPDDRMLAHYLLGRAYYDMGETPLALHHYHEAIESADTTDKDCDFRQLGRIYGQMANTMYGQRMLEKSIEYFRKGYMIGIKAKDTVNAIRLLEYSSSALYLLNKKDSAAAVCRQCESLYLSYGLRKESLNSYPSLILISLEKRDFSQARSLINRYESGSGLFNINGDIKGGREIYYYYKGRYYLGVDKLDSAEFFFRKYLRTLHSLDEREACYSGLLSLYEKRLDSDSIAKYARLFSEANDSSHRVHNTERMHQLEMQYDYSRHQAMAADASARARRLTWVSICLCVALLSLLWLYRNVKAMQRQRTADENRRYNDLLDRLVLSEQTIHRLESEAAELGESVHSKSRELEQERLRNARLKEDLSLYEEDGGNVQWSLEDSMIESLTVVRLHELACHGKAASDRAKKMLRLVMADKQPSFYGYIMSPSQKLTEQEQTVCFLIRLQFARSEISILLDKSPQQVTNICSSINEKLFGRKGTKQLDSSLRQL